MDRSVILGRSLLHCGRAHYRRSHKPSSSCSFRDSRSSRSCCTDSRTRNLLHCSRAYCTDFITSLDGGYKPPVPLSEVPEGSQIGKSSSTEGELEVETHRDMDLRWDFASGQFSWSQDSGLSGAAETVARRAVNCPGSTAAVWRTGEQEQLVSYRLLQAMVEEVSQRMEEEALPMAGEAVVVFLPVCPLTLAVLLACSAAHLPHTLVVSGFSPSALAKVLADTGATTVISSHSWPQLAETLASLTPTPSTLLVNPLEGEGESREEEEGSSLLEDSPLFALYCGGETSVMAGLGQEAGYYQVTSNLGLSGRQRRLGGSECEDDKEDLAVKEDKEVQTNRDYLKDQTTIMDQEFQTTRQDKVVHTIIKDDEDHSQTPIIDMESQETMEDKEDQPNGQQSKVRTRMERNSFRLDYIKSVIKR